jgi:hypothetical protein
LTIVIWDSFEHLVTSKYYNTPRCELYGRIVQHGTLSWKIYIFPSGIYKFHFCTYIFFRAKFTCTNIFYLHIFPSGIYHWPCFYLIISGGIHDSPRSAVKTGCAKGVLYTGPGLRTIYYGASKGQTLKNVWWFVQSFDSQKASSDL